MYAGKIVFAQLIDHLPLHTFRRCVQRYRGHYKVRRFSCLDQYLCMAFAQLTDVLGRIADHKITKLDELMPWSYARARA